ncbi:MAG: hypothetical protein U0350_17045 [Caldilineaceae bacterium]
MPFAALADAIGRYLSELPDEALRSLPAAVWRRLAQIIPSLQDRLPDLSVWPNETALRSDENRQRLIDIVAFLTALARARPWSFSGRFALGRRRHLGRGQSPFPTVGGFIASAFVSLSQ